MGKYLEDIRPQPPTTWTPDRWRRLAEDLLVLTAFVLTSSWLMKP